MSQLCKMMEYPNDLRDAVRNDDDGAVLLDGINAVLDLFGRDGIE